MAESPSHKRAKGRAGGNNEVSLPQGRRGDSISPKRHTEVERSGDTKRLELAAQRLKSGRKPQKVLQVPQNDMDKAAAAMRKKGVSGTIKNMGRTKRRSV